MCAAKGKFCFWVTPHFLKYLKPIMESAGDKSHLSYFPDDEHQSFHSQTQV